MNKIVIDGNIGSGKTTQLNKLEEKGFRVQREPIEEWPLELYYSDPARWGLFFQLIVLKSHARLVKNEPCIYERYPGSGTQVFWPLMTKTPSEDDVYKASYQRNGWDPDIFIWVNTPAGQCFENITQRTQSGDQSVSLSYLEQLETQYEKMFNNLGCLKFEVDGDQSIEEVHNKILKIINFYYKKWRPVNG